jgi:hypothetical protein
MENNKNGKNKSDKKHLSEFSTSRTSNVTKTKLKKLCECDRILSDSDKQFYDLSKLNNGEENINFDNDEFNEDLEDEFLKLSYALDLTESTHSLTKIETNLSSCLKYGFRSGLTHMYMRKFSPLTRGYQVKKNK